MLRKTKATPLAERVKMEGRNLRGNLATELTNQSGHFSGADAHVLKHHGVYQQDNRDRRKQGAREYSYFVRSRLPGGIISWQQLLCEVELSDRFGNGTLRITDRQGIQIHGVKKGDLQPVIQSISKAKATTWGACGDVVRNVMCCPAPSNLNVQREMQRTAQLVSAAFKPQSRAYWELWLRRQDEPSQKLAEGVHNEEPFYGDSYLPRKFKIGFATPEDNCIDVLTHDLGFVAVTKQGQLEGFNAYVGGGMAVTPARNDTFAAVAQPFAFVGSDDALLLARAVVGTHRDFGNRSDRKLSRLRYLIADWGHEKFFAHVDRQFGGGLRPPRKLKMHAANDHLGWHKDCQGGHYLGLHVPNGRIMDKGDFRLKSGLAHVVGRFQLELRITPQQNILLCGIPDDIRESLVTDLNHFGIDTSPPDLPIRREAMSCPALPTCGLAITESERVMDSVLLGIESKLRDHRIEDVPLSVRMTGCPNGCTRPYVAEIGIVGKARGKYTVFLGGSRSGERLAFIFRDSVSILDLPKTLEPVFKLYAANRNQGESFGDFCYRVGHEHLQARCPFPSKNKGE